CAQLSQGAVRRRAALFCCAAPFPDRHSSESWNPLLLRAFASPSRPSRENSAVGFTRRREEPRRTRRRKGQEIEQVRTAPQSAATSGGRGDLLNSSFRWDDEE